MTVQHIERKSLLIAAVGEVPRFRLNGASALILSVRNEIEEQLVANSYLCSAPFKTVSLVFRYGIKEDLKPDDFKIYKKHSELQTSIEFDSRKLKALEEEPEELRRKFKLAVIGVLCDVAANFGLPFEFLDEMRGKA